MRRCGIWFGTSTRQSHTLCHEPERWLGGCSARLRYLSATSALTALVVAATPSAAAQALVEPAQAEAAPVAAADSARCQLAGSVVEEGTREPLARVKVVVEAAKGAPKDERPAVSTLTDDQGHFSFADLRPGRVRVRIAKGSGGPRVRSAEVEETLRPGALRVTYYAGIKSDPYETVVRARPLRREVVETVLTAEELRRIPGNQNDTIKAVQNLPGVARAPFGAGQIVVWGSSPSDTRAYADGVYIPRIYHFGGLRSTISSEFVQDLAFTPGAYSADYGRGLGGVIQVTTRAPKSDRIHGTVTLDLIDGAVTLEGPITKKLHFAVSGRVSWISVFLPIFSKLSPAISPFYWDYQLRLRYEPTPRDEIDVMVFGSSSDITAKVTDPDPNSQVNIDSKSYYARARIRYTHRFGKGKVFWVQPSVGADTFLVDTGSQGFGGVPVKLDVSSIGYNLRAEWRHQPQFDSPTLRFFDYAVGLDFEGTRSQVETLSPVGTLGGDSEALPGGGTDNIRDAGRAESGFLTDGFFSDTYGSAVRERLRYHLLSTAPYLTARFRFANDRIEISPQLRLSIEHIRHDSQGSQDTDPTSSGVRTLFFAEPRLLFRAEILKERLALKAGVGLFHQAPQGAELSPRFGNPQLGFQKGTTYVVGLDVDLVQGLHLETQGFYKDMRDLVVSDRLDIRYSNDGLGRVYGGEFLLRQPDWKGLTGWLAYTLSRSERKDHPDQPWRLFRYDQTHILTAVISYKLPWWGLMAGARFRYVTGNPTTPTVGGIRDARDQSYSDISGEANAARVPDFHQLDLRIDKQFVFKRWKFGIYVEVQNVYYRKNSEGVFYAGRQLYQQGNIIGLPIFPNLGLRAEF